MKHLDTKLNIFKKIANFFIFCLLYAKGQIMKIHKIYTQNCIKNNCLQSSTSRKFDYKYNLDKDITSFSSARTHKVVDGVTVNCNYTNMFRGDMNWDALVEYLDKKYENEQHVKIYCYACSDGSEPYSLALKLLDKLGEEKSKKFLPLLAKDIDKEQIDSANDGLLYMHNKDIEAFSSNIKNYTFDNFFEKDNSKSVKTERNIVFEPYRVKDSLQKLVTFEKANILEESLTKDYTKSVLLFRNAWTFISLGQQEQLAEALYKNMDEKSTLMIGNSDLFKSNANEYLTKIGLKPTKSEIFTNSETDYPSNSPGLPLSQKEKIPQEILFEKANFVC